MEKDNQEIINELKKLNKKIDQITNNNRFFVYNTNPAKFGFFNFLGGTFHALGTIFGTVIVASVVVYLFSQFNITKSISNWIKTTLNQVDFTKISAPEMKQIETVENKIISPTPTIEQLN